jgi:hypothetical protein
MYLINHDTNREVMAQSANIIFYGKNVIEYRIELSIISIKLLERIYTSTSDLESGGVWD